MAKHLASLGWSTFSRVRFGGRSFRSIWLNSFIRIGNNMLLPNKFNSYKAIKIKDIYDLDKRGFCSFEEFREIISGRCSFIEYYSILAAIPNTWKRQLEITNGVDLDWLSLMENLRNSQMVSRSIYQKINTRKVGIDPSHRLWARELECELTTNEWSDLFTYIQKVTLSTKLRYFQYRLIHRKITTNWNRSKWDKSVRPVCVFCKDVVETQLHIFWECAKIQKLWENLMRWMKHMLKMDLKLSPSIIIYNNYNGLHKDMINCFILIIKQYIYIVQNVKVKSYHLCKCWVMYMKYKI